MTDKDISPAYEAADSGTFTPVDVPADRLEETSPVSGEHKPAAVLGTDGSLMTGTIIHVFDDVTPNMVQIDIGKGRGYFHKVRNVLTYAAEAEDTFAQLDVGTPVYYDPSPTMPAGYYLSLSPLDNVGDANTLFGWVGLAAEEVDTPFNESRNPYPIGSAVTGTSHDDICIIQA